MASMAIESVGNAGTANVTTYQATAPKAVKAVETVAESGKGKTAPKPTVKPQTIAKPQATQTTEAAPNKSEESEFEFPIANGVDALKMQNEMSQEKMHKALDNINRKLSHTSCEYGYDDTTNRVTIKIIDKETDEVIRELPPEKTLQMIAKAWELAGLLVDERL